MMRAIADPLASLPSTNPKVPPLSSPLTFERPGDTFTFSSHDEDAQPIVVTLDHIREAHDALYAEVAVSRKGSELYFERLNLLSSKRKDVVRTLTERARDIAWPEIIEPACRQTIEAIRR